MFSSVTRSIPALLLFALALGCGAGGGAGKKVIVLGFDGMDYSITREFMASGMMPSFSRLAAKGQFTPLGTSVPPLSPVAWSNFITGMDAGGHGIFDFIHRDPETTIPYASTTRTLGPEETDSWLSGWLPGWLSGNNPNRRQRGKHGRPPRATRISGSGERKIVDLS